MPLNINGSVISGSTAQTFRYNNIIKRGLVLHLDATINDSYIGTGTIWYDISGNDNNSTLTNGPTFSSTNSGIINFDGVNDYVESNTTSNNFTFGTGDFTIDMWYYPLTSYAASNSYLIDLGTNGTRLQMYNNNIYFFGANSTYALGSTGSGFTINNWYHIVATRIGTSLSIYINGILVGSGTNGDNLTETKYRIAAYGGASTGYNFNGRIASVKIYKGVGFTSTMVVQNYNCQRNKFGV
jgi:hypothetical protein